MTEPIEDRYFGWLYAKVAPLRRSTPSNTYRRLFAKLHATPFVWKVTGDDNRAADGIDLRDEFLRESRSEYDEAWMAEECSVLEMLIAFAKSVEYDTTPSSEEWFWIFLENLGLSEISDGVYEMEAGQVDEILHTFVWRTYDRLGHGGICPLRYSDHDQRRIQIWYQFCEYVEENKID